MKTMILLTVLAQVTVLAETLEIKNGKGQTVLTAQQSKGGGVTLRDGAGRVLATGVATKAGLSLTTPKGKQIQVTLKK